MHDPPYSRLTLPATNDALQYSPKGGSSLITRNAPPRSNASPKTLVSPHPSLKVGLTPLDILQMKRRIKDESNARASAKNYSSMQRLPTLAQPPGFETRTNPEEEDIGGAKS